MSKNGKVFLVFFIVLYPLSLGSAILLTANWRTPTTRCAAPADGCLAEDHILALDVIGPYVEIRSDRGTGSGVHVGGGFVLTAAHVVSVDAPCTLLKRSGGKTVTWKADTVSHMPIRDLALIRVAGGSMRGEEAARVDPLLVVRRGEPCYYVGTPGGFHASLERSIINHDFVKVRESYFTVVNGNGWYGSSGGPLYVRRGNHFYLVGIASEVVRVDARTPVAFVPLDDIASCVRGLPRRVGGADR